VHLANLAHAPPSIAELERVNVAGTLRLAQQAAERGVKHLIFLSSIKAVGDESPDRPLREDDPPGPKDPYGRAKLDAERGLQRISSISGLRVTVLRPPLVYGPGVKGNFAALLRAVARGYPLPLASIENRRSLIYVGNLVDAILLCAARSDLRWRVYHVCDGQAVSTPDLVRALARFMSRGARMFPCPPALLELFATIVGRGASARSLTRSLVVDDSALRAALGWHPPFSLEEGIRSSAQGNEGRR
jgi:nucleoside-diphosphate-sugar epimerase